MSDPKEKNTGKAPEKKNGGKKPENKGSKRLFPSPKRSTGGPKAAKRTAPLTTQQKIFRGLYIALTVISAIIVLGYIGVNLFAAPPDVTKPGPGGVTEVTRPKVTQVVDEKTGEIIEMEIPGLSADRKKEFYTFLLVGQSQDEGGKLTDTMMLVAYDVPNQALGVMSLPRDTYVLYNGSAVLLNSIYNRGVWRAQKGEDPDRKGMEALKKEVQELTGIYPDFEVVIQWTALGELVDAIGGIYFEVPFDMYYNDLSQHFKIDLKKGYQLLDGDGAMGLVRWRHNSDDRGHISSTYGYAEGDIGRIKTQQAFMKEVIKQCLQMDNLLSNLGEYVDIFQKNVTTDLSVGNIAYFARSALTGLNMDNVRFETLPWYSAGDSHILPSGSQLLKLINESFNPYESDIRLGELSLATMDNIPRPSETPDPEESLDPDESPDPNESPDPDASPDPDKTPDPEESEGALLPPGTFSRPSASPAPGESGRPAESSRPSESPRPGNSESPNHSEAPEESRPPAATAEPTPAPEATPEPPAEIPTPVLTPPPVVDEEPLLPPM